MPVELSKALRALRSAFWAVGAFSLVINVLLLVPALYMLQIYDRVLASRNEVTLAMLTLILLGLLALEAMLERVRARVMIRSSAALDVALAPRVFEASFERYLRARSGNPAAAIADLGHIRHFLTGRGVFAFFDAPWTPVYLFVIYLLSPWLALFALVAAALLLALAYVNERATAPALAEAGKIARSASDYAGSSLRNAEAIAALGMLTSLRKRWFERQCEFLAVQARANERAASLAASSKFLRTALQSGILGVGALLLLDNQLTAGGMIAASILLGRALAPLDLAISTWKSLVPARGAYTRLKNILAAHPAPTQRTSLPRPLGHLSMENVALGAPGSAQAVLSGISMQVPAGTVVGVVGPSAAGKSTLARALVGVWVPLGGQLRLDGAELGQWDRDQLGSWIGYLPQDVELFDGTVAQNIARFGEPDSEQIVAAARKAGVHDMVLRLPAGYDTPIGESGVALSGGQRQRVALARALYGDPALIVLDEPNASLDEAGDEALVAALNQLRKERRTVFVMTHRAHILAATDVVAMLSGGRLIAHGPREHVLKGLRKAA